MKKLVSLGVSLVLALSLSVPAFAAGPSFSDVPTSHWAYSYVEGAADKGWVTGIGGGKFNPDGKVTGAEWYTMVARALYADQIPDKADSGKWYSDKWYGPYMQVGIDNGFDDYFDVDINESIAERPLTRTEMACVVMQVISQLSDDLYVQSSKIFYDTVKKIPDLNEIPVESSAYTAVVHTYTMGIITGVDSKGTFNGDGLMSRAQAAVALGRMDDLLKAGKLPDASEQPAETTKPVQPTEPSKPSEPSVSTPSDVPTEEEVYNAILALKAQYPDGMTWTNDNVYKIPGLLSTGELHYTLNRGCAAFTLMCQDAAFGPTDWVNGTKFKPRSHEVFDDIRVGDIVRYDNSSGGHEVIVLEKKDDSIIVAEGNYSGRVHWGREITRDFLEANDFFVSTRYPD